MNRNEQLDQMLGIFIDQVDLLRIHLSRLEKPEEISFFIGCMAVLHSSLEATLHMLEISSE